MKIFARKLTKSSLFKVLFIGFAIPFFPFALLCGIASLFRASTVAINNRPVTGVMGLLVAIIMSPVFCLIFTSSMWLWYALSLWVYSWFRKIELEFVEGEIISGTSPPDTKVGKTHSVV